MKLKPILFVAIAAGLAAVSHSLELRGDLAPLAESGVSPERAKYHLMALFLLLGAVGFFVAAGISLLRGLRGLRG